MNFLAVVSIDSVDAISSPDLVVAKLTIQEIITDTLTIDLVVAPASVDLISFVSVCRDTSVNDVVSTFCM